MTITLEPLLYTKQ